MQAYLRIGRAAFGIAIAGALGLGAAQAFASPASPAAAEDSCSWQECNELCIDMGFTKGFCPNPRDPDCVCL